MTHLTHHAPRSRQIKIIGAITFVALATALAYPGLTSAQSASGQANTVEPMLPPSPIQSFASELASDGIQFNSRYLGEFAANPSGGQRQGSDFAGEFNIGATIDLSRAAHLDGGSVNILFTARDGRNLAADTINNSVPVQEIFGDGQTYQLTLLTYSQTFLKKKVRISFGRTELADTFLESSLYCDFQSNGLCGRPYVMGKDTSTSFYPLAVWGGHIQVNPFPDYYVKVGLYQSNPTLNPVKTHGFDWNINRSNGFLIPVEVGYAWRPNGGTAENRYDIGVIFDRTHFTNPIFDAQGRPFLLSSVAPAQEYGRTAVYAQAQQLIYQNPSEPTRNVYAFAGVLFGASGNQQVARYGGEVGIVDTGPFLSRPEDSLDIGVSMIHYGSAYINSLFEARRATGGTQHPNQNLIMGEVNYNIQLSKWLAIMPNVQYVVHPDGLAGSVYPASNLPNALVVGIQFNVNVGKALGFDVN